MRCTQQLWQPCSSHYVIQTRSVNCAEHQSACRPRRPAFCREMPVVIGPCLRSLPLQLLVQELASCSWSLTGCTGVCNYCLPTSPTRSPFLTSQVQFFSTCWFLKVMDTCTIMHDNMHRLVAIPTFQKEYPAMKMCYPSQLSGLMCDATIGFPLLILCC